MALFYSLKTIGLLPDITNMQDGSVANVNGFWAQFDGGGGTFVFDSSMSLNPSTAGYSSQYDGMVVKPSNGTGRWVRQSGRGKLNIRWFGARTNNAKNAAPNSGDCSKAFNVALHYAQFDFTETNSENNLFINLLFNNSGKTIFFPSGKYYFNSQIDDITSGVVLEGEGSNGSTDQIGTTLIVNYSSTNDEHGFIRFVGYNSNNTGGGLKNLRVTVKKFTPFNANLVTLFSKDDNGNLEFDPVSFWTADSIVLNCKNSAKRAFFARSFDTREDERHIRDINLINCYFSGATNAKSTIVISNVANFYMLGGYIYAGDADGIIPGIWITGSNGCANFVITGSTLHTIKIVKASKSYINCRYEVIDANAGGVTEVVKSVTTENLAAPPIV